MNHLVSRHECFRRIEVRQQSKPDLEGAMMPVGAPAFKLPRSGELGISDGDIATLWPSVGEDRG
jgi:hypothetical protein